MSYPRDLDEIGDAELAAEIARRAKLRKRGLCPYCRALLVDSACRYPEIHVRDITEGR